MEMIYVCDMVDLDLSLLSRMVYSYYSQLCVHKRHKRERIFLLYQLILVSEIVIVFVHNILRKCL